MQKLIIAEKPAVAKDIAAALGGFKRHSDGYFERDDLIVANAIGHLVELDVPEAKSAARGFSGLPILVEQFGLEAVAKHSAQFNLLKRLLNSSQVTEVYNACDAGREGELIFGLIFEHAKCKKPTHRMWFQTMTSEGLRDAYVNARPGHERAGLMAAAKCRSESDWLVGINGSRGFTALRTKLVGSFESMNVGRVQTPTLALMVDRENAILTFQAKDFWEINGRFTANAGEYKGKLLNPQLGGSADNNGEQDADSEASASAHRFFDKAAAQALLQRCQGQPVDSVRQEVSESSRKPPSLFDLTTLQREANKRFRFTAKKTLGIAQALYETHKMTTYPRTEGTALPEDYGPTAKAALESLKGSPWDSAVSAVLDNNWVNPSNKRVFNNEKITDHFAIIPTGAIGSGLSDDERKIYELITLRFIAAFFPDARMQKTKRITTVAGLDFLSTGTVVIDPGWLRVVKDVGDDGKLKGTGTDLCAVADGEKPVASEIMMTEAKTTPPPRYTEAALLGAMETAGKHVEDDELRAAMKERGLGTPATRASIIEGLCDSGSASFPKEPYVRRQDNQMVPSEKAMNLIPFARMNGIAFLTKADMTGEWESKLKLMEKGDYDRPRFMAEIRAQTGQMIETLRDQDSKIAVEMTPIEANCPKCKTARVQASKNSFSCVAECGFRLNRSMAKRPITNEEMRDILNGQKIGPLQGFYSNKSKKNFSAHLKLGDGMIEFVFESTYLKALCPKCDGKMQNKPKVFECEECKFLVFRSFSGRDFKDSEMEVLLTKGKIPALNGFISSKDKKYSANVELSIETGRIKPNFDNLPKTAPSATRKR